MTLNEKNNKHGYYKKNKNKQQNIVKILLNKKNI